MDQGSGLSSEQEETVTADPKLASARIGDPLAMLAILKHDPTDFGKVLTFLELDSLIQGIRVLAKRKHGSVNGPLEREPGLRD